MRPNTTALYEQILLYSRQSKIGPLSEWFISEMEQQIDGSDDYSKQWTTPEQLEYRIYPHIVDYLKAYREEAGAFTVVLGVSGGVDSALTARLFKDAGWNVEAFLMPIHQLSAETERGKQTCDALSIPSHIIDLSQPYVVMCRIHLADHDVGLHNDKLDTPKQQIDALIRRGNIRARLRMVALYNFASKYQGVVASTDNLSELQAGFWTLHGDVGDISPIQSLNKSWEVPYLASICGVPESVWTATPTDGLGISNGDEAQLGISYLEWDITAKFINHIVLDNLVNDKTAIKKYATGDRAKHAIDCVWDRMARTWYKRKNPINIEHPVLHTLAELQDLDRQVFHPDVVI